MTDNHPITPPLKLVHQWFLGAKAMPVDQWVTDVATQAARWGADQELEAIQKEIITQAWFADPRHRLAQLRAARRPKPPSLKEQALNEFDSLLGDSEAAGAAVILRALEALPDD